MVIFRHAQRILVSSNIANYPLRNRAEHPCKLHACCMRLCLKYATRSFHRISLAFRTVFCIARCSRKVKDIDWTTNDLHNVSVCNCVCMQCNGIEYVRGKIQGYMGTAVRSVYMYVYVACLDIMCTHCQFRLHDSGYNLNRSLFYKLTWRLDTTIYAAEILRHPCVGIKCTRTGSRCGAAGQRL